MYDTGRVNTRETVMQKQFWFFLFLLSLILEQEKKDALKKKFPRKFPRQGFKVLNKKNTSAQDFGQSTQVVSIAQGSHSRPFFINDVKRGTYKRLLLYVRAEELI